MYHPGWIESKHKPRDATWYREQDDDHCCKSFCDKLEKGDYIPCGGSGDSLYVGIFTMSGSRRNLNSRTCGFVFGKPCADLHLERKWTCCKKGGKEKTIKQMYEISGCKSCNSGILDEKPKED